MPALWPVPLAAPDQLRRPRSLCRAIEGPCSTSSDPALFLFPAELGDFAGEAAQQLGIDGARLGIARRPSRPTDADLARGRRPTTSPICNIRAARPASRTASRSPIARLLDNLRAHGLGLELRDTDRVVSWLPWYHDMGLVGCLLSPVANQISVDYLKTEDFARRPLAWLDLITRNPGHDAQLLADLRL